MCVCVLVRGGVGVGGSFEYLLSKYVCVKKLQCKRFESSRYCVCVCVCVCFAGGGGWGAFEYLLSKYVCVKEFASASGHYGLVALSAHHHYYHNSCEMSLSQ